MEPGRLAHFEGNAIGHIQYIIGYCLGQHQGDSFYYNDVTWSAHHLGLPVLSPSWLAEGSIIKVAKLYNDFL